MPKNKTKKDKINYEFFKTVIHEKGYTIKSIADANKDMPSEKTIRRAKKEKCINPEFLDSIAKYLNLSKRYLSGEMFDNTTNKLMKDFLRSDIKDKKSKQFPYIVSAKETNNNSCFDEAIKNMLLVYDISYDKYLNLNEKDQNSFLEDLNENITKVLIKYFNEDEYGRTKKHPEYLSGFEKIISEKENNELNRKIALSLKEKYKKNPPLGYKYSYIKTLEDRELVDFDYYLQYVNKNENEIDYFEEKYKNTKNNKKN